MTPEEKQLTDRYLENALTGVELKAFLDRIDSDEKFRKQVGFQNLLIEGIQQAEENRIADALLEHIAYRKPAIPFGLKLIFTFLLITGSGIVLWDYLGPGSTGQKHDYMLLDFLRYRKESKDLLPVTTNQTEGSKKSAFKRVSSDKQPVEESKVVANSDSGKNLTEETDAIEVKKDQLLISVNLKSVSLDEGNPKPDGDGNLLTKNVVDKLNPAGDLPSDKPKNTNYFVEFWISPVNYKGYKLVEDKLILFGIEEPDAVKLFTKSDKLWMKYGTVFFLLESNDQFESFVPANEIPSALK